MSRYGSSTHGDHKVRYPKGSAHPSKDVGETETTSWPNHTDVTYPHGGPETTTYNGDQYQTKLCTGNKSSAPGNDYPKKSRSFGTYRHTGKK